MKTIKNIFLLACLIAPLISFSQSSQEKTETNKKPGTHQKRTYSRRTTTRTDTIRKQNAPILEDNGTVNSTEIVDGSRSSTGRPGADTLVNYTVKKRKKTSIPEGAIIPDSTKRKKK